MLTQDCVSIIRELLIHQLNVKYVKEILREF